MAGLLTSEGDSQRCSFVVRCNTYQQLLGDDSSTLLQKVKYSQHPHIVSQKKIKSWFVNMTEKTSSCLPKFNLRVVG